MKRVVLSICALLLYTISIAQVPESFSYQAIVRDVSNNPITNQNVSFRMSILKGSISGSVEYTELHSATTNGLGLVTLAIGDGTDKTGDITSIDWGADIYFLKVEIDPIGGTDYDEMGTTQLLSVPYALVAYDAFNVAGSDGMGDGSGLDADLLDGYNSDYFKDESDPLYSAWDKSAGIAITESQITNLQSYLTTETQSLSDVLTLGTDAGNKEIVNINQQGIGTATPDASSALEISSTTQGFLPPRVTQPQRNAITPVEGLIIYNISTKKPNYYDGTGWKNYDGTIAGIPAIGDTYEGGTVFYILQSGDPGYDANVPHGFISAPSDQSTGAEWGCYGITISGADGIAIGTGNQNTINIVNGCTTAGIAAKLCFDLVLNGYSDWFLPSKDELNKLYLNKVAIGGFANSYYWSSTESDNDVTAWGQSFYDGNQGNLNKGHIWYVRAVRAF